MTTGAEEEETSSAEQNPEGQLQVSVCISDLKSNIRQNTVDSYI